MVTSEVNEKPRVIVVRNSRRNEIVAILLLALALLLTLCLVSAAYFPNDPSWNSAGQLETRNWAGAIGANVAAALFQAIGVGAFLLPPLLLAAAWRRFRARKIQTPFYPLLGLIVLVLSASALLSISQLKPVFDSSVQPGGLVGTVIARTLASGLNTAGATVILIALAATGLLLATNFSFIGLYEKLIAAIGDRFAFVRTAPARFTAWRQARREAARLQKEKKLALRAEQQAAKSALKAVEELTPAERVAEFMRQTDAATTANLATATRSVTAPPSSVDMSAEPARAATAAVGAGATVVETSGRRSLYPSSRNMVVDDEVEVEDMVKGASVLRKKAEAPGNGKLP
ncbi:MAG TPA: DNA translocase FtsK 4TM domain-containing protein, partial [Pyrinomonadaceae bacterium]|nr:DNA translocase FtsK 4TM domain-containing protein [Pyrinomonadaceae bacterium]